MIKKLGIWGLSFSLFLCFALTVPAKTADDLLNEAKAMVKTVSIDEVKKMVDSKEKVILLDVRDMKDFQMGHIPGSVNMPRAISLSGRLLEYHLGKLIPDKNAKVVVYCDFDTRSPLTVKTMNEVEYKNAAYMKGGSKAWKEAGYPMEKE
jgi:rhodanese-related sulfurtransferase